MQFSPGKHQRTAGKDWNRAVGGAVASVSLVRRNRVVDGMSSQDVQLHP